MNRDAEADIAERLHGRVLVVTGAGVSAESNIPTFRGAGGYWRNHDPTQLATADAFFRDPGLVWEWYDERRTLIRSAQPNPAHLGIAALACLSSDLLVVTQNVDDLHERAGTPQDRLVHIHGEMCVTRCVRCDYSTRERVTVLPAPFCPKCQSLLRPGVVWFGERLDPRLVARIEGFLDVTVDVPPLHYGHIRLHRRLDDARQLAVSILKRPPRATGGSRDSASCGRSGSRARCARDTPQSRTSEPSLMRRFYCPSQFEHPHGRA